MTHERLKARIRGSVITVFDPGHAAACDDLIWNGRKPARRTQVIVRAADTTDVVEAVRHAAAGGLTVSARTGGHQFTGISAQADMVVDLGQLDALRVDAANKIAVVGPGVTNARLADALERYGLAFPLGHCASVPMGGYLLGGGIGWNSGAWGIACHSVRAVEVVLADGSRVTATADTHADIFWAARGAGPEFFGIVTAYHVALQEAPRAQTTQVRVYPTNAAAEVAAWAEKAVANAPAHVEFTAKVGISPVGPAIEAIATVFAATPEEAQQVLDALGRDAPAGEVAVIGPMPTTVQALYEITGASTPAGSRYGVDCLWLDGGFAPALQHLAARMATTPSTSSFGLISLRSNARPVPQVSAFSVAGGMLATIYGIWRDADADAENLGWLRSLADGFGGQVQGAYVGEADLERPGARPRTLSDAALARLGALQAQYDPVGVFKRGKPAARPHAA